MAMKREEQLFRAASQPISVATTADTPTPPEQAVNGATSSKEASTEAPTEAALIDSDVEMAPSNASAADAMQHLGGNSRELIKAIQKVEALEIDSTLPPLPKIVVVGDQSAGKSSVIEALCDISLPREAGTCTRCPFLITTSAATGGQSWECRVSLHRRYTYQPGHKAGEDGYDDWVEQFLEVKDFVLVSNKKDLEVALRRAQLAILNPGKDYYQFTREPIEQGVQYQTQVGFSPNIISLEITGDNLAELSLFDLPGAINSTAKANEFNLVKFVQKLLMMYMSDEKAIILLASAANQDQETGTAYRYLLECFAQDRCLGVLTKPDLWIADATESKVKAIGEMLSSNAFKVGYGWYITRQLSQVELDRNITYEGARYIEATFFDKPPWNTTLAQHSERFGIPYLQNALSQKLTSEILRTLPEVLGRVQARIETVDALLVGFPEKAAAPALSVIMEIDAVKNALLLELDPDGDAEKTPEKFRKRYRDIFFKFNKDMKELKPAVIVTTPGYEKPSILLDSDQEMDNTPSKSRKTNSGYAMNATPIRPFPSSSKTPNTSGKQRRSKQPTEEPELAQKAVFYLDKVKDMYDSSSGADMGGAVDLKVNKQLMLDTMKVAGAKVESLLHKIHNLFLSVLGNTLGTVLAQRRTTRLFVDIDQISQGLWAGLITEVAQTIRCFVAGETHRPIAYNIIALRERQTYYEEDIRKRRLIQRICEYYEQREAEGYNVPKQSDWEKKATDATFINNTLGPDVYGREMANLPGILAYYDIASARLVDCIANQLELSLLHKYGTRLHRKLLEDLHTDDSEHCALLVAEDQNRERQRTALLGEKVRLQQALEELRSLPGFYA